MADIIFMYISTISFLLSSLSEHNPKSVSATVRKEHKNICGKLSSRKSNIENANLVGNLYYHTVIIPSLIARK